MNRETSIHASDTLIVTERRQRRRWVILGAVAVITLVAIGLMMMMASHNSKTAAAAGKAAGQVPAVTVVVPGQSQVGRTITASGPLGARHDQPIGIAGQGGRVIRVLVNAGSWVHAGQVLAVVDRSVQAEQAAQQAAQIEAARANAALAQADYERAVSLQSRGFVSKAEIDSKRAARDAANAQVRVAQAQLGATRAQIGQLNVVAPSAGLVLARNVELRSNRRSGIDRPVPSRRRWPDGDAGPACAEGPNGGSRRHGGDGDARRIEPQLPRKRLAGCSGHRPAVAARTRPNRSSVRPVDPPRRLRRGQDHRRADHGAPMLPQSAVLSDDQGNYVYVINAKNEVERRNITIGIVNEHGVSIASGLSGNERVVLSAGPFLNPGQKVKPTGVAAH